MHLAPSCSSQEHVLRHVGCDSFRFEHICSTSAGGAFPSCEAGILGSNVLRMSHTVAFPFTMPVHV